MIFDRLADLRQTAAVAVVAVADRADRDLEVEFVVVEVRLSLAQIPGLAGGAQERAGDAELEQTLARDDPNPLVRWRKISLRSSSASYWSTGSASRRRTRASCVRSRPGCPRRRRRPGSSGCACAGRSTSRRGRASCRARESIEVDRHRAEVERRRAEPDQVRMDPVEFEVEHPQVLRARRDLELDQLLDRATEGLHVGEVGEVVHPLDERDHLPVVLVSQVFSMPVWTYPTTGFRSLDDFALEVTISRSTPWVAGWCGPMLTVIISCSGSSMSPASGADRRGPVTVAPSPR